MTLFYFYFFFNDTATTGIYTLSLHDALPILSRCGSAPVFILPISCCGSAHAFYTYQFLLRQHPCFLYCPFLVAAAPRFLYCPVLFAAAPPLFIFTNSCCGSAPAFHTADRKSTRLNSSHTVISYAVFCLKKKTKKYETNN